MAQQDRRVGQTSERNESKGQSWQPDRILNLPDLYLMFLRQTDSMRMLTVSQSKDFS
jgi:hypothetical protein